MKRRALWALAVAALAGGLLWATRPSPRRPRQDPRFLTLGELAADLARDPKTFDAVLERIGAGRTSVGLVGDTQRAVMRRLFESADYAGLDRQPRVTLEMLRAGLDLLAQRRTGQAPPVEPTADPCGASKPSPDAAAAEPLGIPTGAIPRGVQELAPLGLDLFLGERVDPRKSARYCDSARLADLLEWLATDEGARRGVAVGAGVAHSPEELVRALAGSGHRVEVRDERFLANFGDLERSGVPVATPLWVRAGGAYLPVPHAQVTLSVDGPDVRAEATLYNALDLGGTGGGGTRYRADLARDPAWVGGRLAHRYTGDRAVEAVRLMGRLRRAAAEKVARHALPLDGYFALGVCTLAPALVEQALTGRTTLWPMTHDPALFAGDDEVDRLVRALPSDREGSPPPTAARLRGAVPWDEAESVPLAAVREALAAIAGAP